MTRWVCFSRPKRRGFLRTWHMVYSHRGQHHVLCGRNLLTRTWLCETHLPARLCINCLLRLSWRGRAGWVPSRGC
jgi:hypothetical protein